MSIHFTSPDAMWSLIVALPAYSLTSFSNTKSSIHDHRNNSKHQANATHKTLCPTTPVCYFIWMAWQFQCAYALHCWIPGWQSHWFWPESRILKYHVVMLYSDWYASNSRRWSWDTKGRLLRDVAIDEKKGLYRLLAQRTTEKVLDSHRTLPRIPLSKHIARKLFVSIKACFCYLPLSEEYRVFMAWIAMIITTTLFEMVTSRLARYW